MQKKLLFQTRFLFLMLFLCGCGETNNEPTILEYFRWNDDNPREYVCHLSDTTIMRIILTQKERKLDIGIWEFKYKSSRSDSIPISLQVERYYDKNEFELISLSLYELGPNDIPIEIKGKIIEGAKQSLNDTLIRYTVLYDFIRDSSCKMKINYSLHSQYLTFNPLNKKFLKITSTDKYSLIYTDDRKDTSFSIKSVHVYEKNKGLIRFEQEDSGQNLVFTLQK